MCLNNFPCCFYLELPGFITTKDVSGTPRLDMTCWIQKTCDFTHRCAFCLKCCWRFVPSDTGRLINSISHLFLPKRNVAHVQWRTLPYELDIFQTGETSHFDKVVMRTESSAYNFVSLKIGRVFQNQLWALHISNPFLLTLPISLPGPPVWVRGCSPCSRSILYIISCNLIYLLYAFKSIILKRNP